MIAEPATRASFCCKIVYRSGASGVSGVSNPVLVPAFLRSSICAGSGRGTSAAMRPAHTQRAGGSAPSQASLCRAPCWTSRRSPAASPFRLQHHTHQHPIRERRALSAGPRALIGGAAISSSAATISSSDAFSSCGWRHAHPRARTHVRARAERSAPPPLTRTPPSPSRPTASCPRPQSPPPSHPAHARACRGRNRRERGRAPRTLAFPNTSPYSGCPDSFTGGLPHLHSSTTTTTTVTRAREQAPPPRAAARRPTRQDGTPRTRQPG